MTTMNTTDSEIVNDLIIRNARYWTPGEAAVAAATAKAVASPEVTALRPLAAKLRDCLAAWEAAQQNYWEAAFESKEFKAAKAAKDEKDNARAAMRAALYALFEKEPDDGLLFEKKKALLKKLKIDAWMANI